MSMGFAVEVRSALAAINRAITAMEDRIAELEGELEALKEEHDADEGKARGRTAA